MTPDELKEWGERQRALAQHGQWGVYFDHLGLATEEEQRRESCTEWKRRRAADSPREQ